MIDVAAVVDMVVVSEVVGGRVDCIGSVGSVLVVLLGEVEAVAGCHCCCFAVGDGRCYVKVESIVNIIAVALRVLMLLEVWV